MRLPRLLIPALAAAFLSYASFGYAQSITIGPASGLKFNLNPTFDTTTTTGAAAFQDFQTAALRWSSLFSDNITVNLDVGLADLGGGGIIGNTGSSELGYSYGIIRTALNSDARSADDVIAVANLAVGTGSPELINRTSDNPNGNGSTTAYQVSDGTVALTTANAKALNIYSGSATASDATITFNSQFSFDYNEADGVDGDKIDFLFVATHEIGHSLGFISGVDGLDYGPGSTAGSYAKTTLDLFRYSAASFAQGKGVTDFTTGTSSKYFSINGGTTIISASALFSTGVHFGDGRQTSHWKDNLGAGIMDPTAGFGEIGAISQNDIRAFDVIGYNLAAPEPSLWISFSLGLLSLGALALRARKR